jgi:hypothetical protein
MQFSEYFTYSIQDSHVHEEYCRVRVSYSTALAQHRISKTGQTKQNRAAVRKAPVRQAGR